MKASASAASTVQVVEGPGRSRDTARCPGSTDRLTGEGGLGDARDRHAQVERGLHRPCAGALGAGLVEDDVHERLAGRGVDLAEHLGGDLDQVRLQLAGVPLGEHVGDLGGALAGAAADEVVRLGDELHVGVLDAVVHHLHEVPGTVVADVRDARLALGDRGDRARGSDRASPRTRPSRRA